MLWAAPGTGKTLLTLTLGLMVAGGGSVLGWQSPKPRKVLLVDGEMAAEDLQERVMWLMDTIDGIDKEAARRNLLILSRNWQHRETVFPDLGEREGKAGRKSGQNVLIEEATKHKAELVLLDNFSTLAEVADENDAAAMTPTLAFLLRLKAHRIGCVLVHHSGKDGGTYRGSSKLATTFEVILGLKPAADGGASDGAAFTLEWTKYRREPNEATRSKRVALALTPDGRRRWTAEASEQDEWRLLKNALVTCQHTTQRELATALGWDAAKVSRTKQAMIDAGSITEKAFAGYLTEARQLRDGDTGEDF